MQVCSILRLLEGSTYFFSLRDYCWAQGVLLESDWIYGNVFFELIGRNVSLFTTMRFYVRKKNGIEVSLLKLSKYTFFPSCIDIQSVLIESDSVCKYGFVF